MKVEIINDNIIVFLNKYISKKLDYQNINNLENEFKNIFDKLNNYYDIKIKGYYDVTVYIDNNYGSVLELEKDDLCYLDEDDVIDMRIIIKNINFLYKVSNVIDLDIPYEVYGYNKNLYIKLLDNLDNIKMGRLLENSVITYKDVNNIIKYGKYLKNIQTMI